MGIMSVIDELAQEVCRAIDSDGVEGALGFFAPEVVLDDLPAAPKPRLPGHDSLRRHFARFTDNFDDFHLRVEEVHSLGSKVMLALRIGGQGVSGATAWGTVHHVYTVRGREIVRVEIFRERAAAARAAGLT